MSKQLLKSLLLWSLPLFLSANFVSWLGNYDKAHQKALQEKKPLLILVVKKDSTLSSKIIHSVFMNKTYVDIINQKMVPVIVTYEGTLSYPIEMYYTTIFPTLFFVDSSREVSLTETLYGENISVKSVKVNLKKLKF